MYACSFYHSLHNIFRLYPIPFGRGFMSPHDRLFNSFSLLRIKDCYYNNNTNNNNNNK